MRTPAECISCGLFIRRPLFVWVCLGALSIASPVRGEPLPTSLPDIWNAIQESADAIQTDEAARNDPVRRSALFWEQVRKIAGRFDRRALVDLHRFADFAADRSRTETESARMMSLASCIAILIADLDGSRGLRARTESLGFTTARSAKRLIVISMDVIHDGESRDALRQIVFPHGRLFQGEPRNRCYFTRPTSEFLALQLLRGYEIADLREQLNQALEDERERLKKLVIFEQAQTHWLPDEIRAVIASMDYAASLADERQRARFREFESRLWRARGLDLQQMHSMRAQFRQAAALVAADWRPGDEEFLLHAFEEPHSMPDEKLILANLCGKLDDAGIKRLQAVALGESANADFANDAIPFVQPRD